MSCDAVEEGGDRLWDGGTCAEGGCWDGDEKFISLSVVSERECFISQTTGLQGGEKERTEICVAEPAA